MDGRREKKWVGNTEMKKKRKRTCHVAKHFKGADFCFRSGTKRVQIS